MTETTFGWDASHYDAPPTRRDGIDLYTHKLTDGDHFYEDLEFGPALDAARRLEIPILGPYHVLHGRRSLANQADWLVARASVLAPWWRQHDCWIWQADAEPFDYLTAPTIDEINAFGDAVCVRAGCPAERFLVYAPQWHYGTALTGLRYRLWASKYGTNPVGWYRDVYPGNTSSRWVAPIDPLLLQYGSNATIAGQTTCDANAYRGTLDQLRAALRAGPIGDDVLVDEREWLKDIHYTLTTPEAGGAEHVRWITHNGVTDRLAADVAAIKIAIAALVASSTSNPGDPNAITALLDRMQELADAELTRDTEREERHTAEVRALQAQITELRQSLANAAFEGAQRAERE